MGEIFTDTAQDNTDNTFTDTTQDTGQEIQTPADSSKVVNPPPDASVPESPEVTATPTPTETTEPPAPGEDKPQEETEEKTEYTVSDIYKLLKKYQKSEAEYQTQVLENDKVYIEQSKNLLSVSSLLLLTVGFLSGILLARIVWRKL